jgi:sodium/hydrogen antiporter
VDFLWFYVIAGALFVSMALAGSLLTRLPLSTAMIYLVVGILLGPAAGGLLDVELVADAHLIERVTEVAVIISLFTAGLKMRVEWRNPIWRIPIRLASISMLVSIGLVTVAGVLGLGLSLGAAVLLGAILAPTDPVLASDVQVTDPGDTDRLRFSLTGEAGLNDGAAFPFVMLGLGLLGLHELGPLGLRWVSVDLLWAVFGGLGIGIVCGTAVGTLMIHLRVHYKEAHGLDDFLALGLLALSYGGALLAHTYGFLAVFAAGLALRAIERRHAGEIDAAARSHKELERAVGEEAAVHPDTAPAYMAEAVLGFTEQLERMAEIAVVILIGALLTSGSVDVVILGFVAVLLLIIRPLAVAIGLLGMSVPPTQRRLMAWFGIRGIGSAYYLAYAIAHGINESDANRLGDVALAAISVSIVVHGISVTPLMERYQQAR